MLTEYNFRLSQLEYVRGAMIELPTFRPDKKQVTFVEQLISGAKATRATFLTKLNALTLAQGATRLAQQKLHDACVAVYQCMTSCFRKDPACTETIGRLPVQDQSVDETLKRGLSIAQCWAGLPNPPEWTEPFVAGEMDRTAFVALIVALDTALSAEVAADEPYRISAAAVRQQQQSMTDFAGAALAQGRAQFKPGTPERAAIDRIPTVSAGQKPARAEFTRQTSPAPGAVHLEFEAEHATSFTVWHQGPGETQFAPVAEVLAPGEYDATGLPAGTHEYQVVGVNSRGEGPASETASVAVAAQQAA